MEKKGTTRLKGSKIKKNNKWIS